MTNRFSNYTEYDEGRKAFFASIPRHKNPYKFAKDFSSDNEPAVQWDLGWVAGEKDWTQRPTRGYGL